MVRTWTYVCLLKETGSDLEKCTYDHQCNQRCWFSQRSFVKTVHPERTCVYNINKAVTFWNVLSELVRWLWMRSLNITHQLFTLEEGNIKPHKAGGAKQNTSTRDRKIKEARVSDKRHDICTLDHTWLSQVTVAHRPHSYTWKCYACRAIFRCLNVVPKQIVVVSFLYCFCWHMCSVPWNLCASTEWKTNVW